MVGGEELGQTKRETDARMSGMVLLTISRIIDAADMIVDESAVCEGFGMEVGDLFFV